VHTSIVVIELRYDILNYNYLWLKPQLLYPYNYTDSWTVMITITSKLCTLQLLFNYISLWEQERDFVLD